MIKKIHYPNLNSLRFLAAFAVIIHHTEQLKSIKHFPNYWDNHDFIPLIGKLGVDLFFVLSGFLITSLLFIEKASPTGIKVKNFIMRRVLRIWPLYFLIMMVAFFIMPLFPAAQVAGAGPSVNEHLLPNIILFALFLPHIQTLIYGPVIYAGQLWSIGIEEQFYLVWSSIVKKLTTRALVNWIFAYIILYLGAIAVLRTLLHIDYRPGGHKIDYDYIIGFVDIMRFDCLLIGALFAVWHKSLKANSFITNKVFQLFIYLLEAYLAYTGYWFHSYFWEVHATLYGIIILNLVRPKTSLINIDFKVFDYLGKISYGIYMYHFFAINLVITLFYKWHIEAFAYPAIFALVIGFSTLSYKYIEAYFLKLKARFSVISTG
jgi:peptidoglycan/LPS O-acetylase OafA/YrhL